MFGNVLGLVEPPAALAGRVHGAGYQQVGAAFGLPCERAKDFSGEALNEGLTEGALTLILVAADQLVDRKLVAPGRDHPVERRRCPQAFAAGHHRSCYGQGQGAAVAMAVVHRQIRPAIRTQPMVIHRRQTGHTLARPPGQAAGQRRTGAVNLSFDMG